MQGKIEKENYSVLKQDEGETDINQMYVDIFNFILKFEELSIRVKTHDKITINEIHLLELIYTEPGRAMSDYAEHMHIALSTFSINIDRLVKKGLAKRERSKLDRRQVYVSVTRQGATLVKKHKRFHLSMMKESLRGVGEEHDALLRRIAVKLQGYFSSERDKLLIRMEASKTEGYTGKKRVSRRV